jgi:hypothetical protein
MKKLILMILVLGFVYTIAKPAGIPANSAIIGAWKCVVNNVPQEYSSSIITFTEKEGKLYGIIKFDNGTEVVISTLKFADGRLLLTMIVEGNSVTADGKVEETKITGSADTPNGKVVFTATRIADKKK